MGLYAVGKRRGLLTALIAAAIVLCALLALFLTVTHNWNDPVSEIMGPVKGNPYIVPYGSTMVSAHRSGGGIFPENTMQAFQGCIASETFRTDVFEFDLHITKDGELILLHDDTLDRTTDCEEVFGVKKARPEDFSLDELRQLNFGEDFTDDAGRMPYRGLQDGDVPDALRVTTLAAVLDYLEANGGFYYVIEIKNKGELGYWAADRLYEELASRELLEKTIVGTFNGDVTRYLDETYPDMLRSASIMEVLGFYVDSMMGISRDASFYRFKALQIPANQYMIKLGTSRLVNYAHAHGIAVQYWTINEPDEIRSLRDIGADCVMSDEPDVAYHVIHESK